MMEFIKAPLIIGIVCAAIYGLFELFVRKKERLAIIEKIGDREPVRMSEVARSIGVTLATLTVACDKLVAKGLVRRVRSQEDRRVVNIMLTDKGRAAYEYHKDFHERMIASLVDTLSPEQTALLAQSLEKLQDFFRHEEASVEGETNG